MQGSQRSVIVQGGKLYALIAEMYRISHELVANVLPVFQDRLATSDDKERLKLTTALGEMFAVQSDQPLHETFPELWTAWLGRFGDRRTEVRLACVTAAVGILCFQSDLRGQLSGERS